ncbi:MAG: hypothetical protein ABSF18_06735, partial [Gammaproteobacteria bacterium]
LLSSNFYIESNEDELFSFLSMYIEEEYKVDWITTCLLNSFISLSMHKIIDQNFGSNKKFTKELYLSKFSKPLYRIGAIYKKNCRFITKFLMLPFLSVIFYFNDKPLYSILFFLIYIAELFVTIHHNPLLRVVSW